MKNNYSRASLSELQNVFKMLSSGKGVREISRILGRSPSTISKWKNRYKPKKRKLWFRLCPYGRAKYVYDRLSNQKRELRKKIPIRDVKTRDYVISQLIDRCSPEEISATMEKEIGSKVSFKTIYNLTKYDRGLKKYLYEKGTARRQRLSKNNPSRFKLAPPTKKSIHLRDLLYDVKSESGHFEVDLIIGTKGTKACILSIIERTSRRKWFFLLSNRKSETVLSKLRVWLLSLDNNYVKTLTLDNGSEFSYRTLITLESKNRLEMYYCDAYKSYQKGAIERANRDFRVFFPKGTNFENVTKQQVAWVENIINSKKIKCLGYSSPMIEFNRAA